MKVLLTTIKRKRLVSFVLYLLLTLPTSLSAQHFCATEGHVNTTNQRTLRSSAVCSQTVYLKINFHFMLKSDGTGNFTEYDDGNGNTSYNGYNYVQDLVNSANSNLANNVQTRLPLGNSVPIPTINLRYVIGGIYFHRDDVHYAYNWNSATNTAYGIDKASEFNVFFPHLSGAEGGVAGGIAPTGANDKWLKLTSVWQQYHVGRGTWAFTGILNHEVGHLLGLYHSFSDACADTYTTGSSGTWCGTGADNNMMDYNCEQRAITPCQWSTMEYHLQNTYANYTTCCTSPPAAAVYSLRSNACTGDAIYLDGFWRAQKNEQNYSLEIYQTDAIGSNTNVSNYYSQSFSGQYGKIDLTSLYSFSAGNIYRVKLTVNGTNCTSTDSDIRWITIQNDIAYLQNLTITSSNDYFSKCHYRIGNNVNTGSTAGDVTISSSAVVNVKSGRTISMELGTTIDPGATATFSISPYASSFSNIAYKSDSETGSNDFLGNENSTASSNIQFFPNPSKGNSSIVFNYSESKLIELSVLNSMGEEVYNQNLGMIKESAFDLNLSNKPNGFYIIKIKSNNESETIKFLLNK